MPHSDDSRSTSLFWPSRSALVRRFGPTVLFTFVTTGVSCASLLLLAGSLTPEDYGEFCFIQVFFGLLLFATSEAGRPVSFAAAVADQQRFATAVFGYWILSGGLAALAGFFTLALLPLWLDSVSRTTIAVLCLGIIIASLNSSHFLDARRHHGIASGIRCVGEICGTFAFVFLLGTNQLSLTNVMYVLAAKWSSESLVAGALVLWPHRNHLRTSMFEEVSKTQRSWITVTASAIIAVIPLHAGIFFVRAFCSPEETAIQGFVQQFAMGVAAAGAFCVKLLQPSVTRQNAGHRWHFHMIFARYVCVVTTTLALALIALHFVIRILPLPEYRESLLPGALQAIAWFAVLSVTLETTFLLGSFEESVVLRCSVFSLMTFLIVSMLLVPHFGTFGACAATLVSSLLSSVLPYFRIIHILRSR